MRKEIFYLFVVLLIACTGSAWAQTADGQTPAVESVCDGLTGDQFGLCNAYCEAMDCDATNTLAAQRACDKVLTNFTATGGTPPCTATTSCCEIHNTAGCDDATCEATVCAIDNFCCGAGGGFWDGACVALADTQCGICGGDPGDPA